MDIDRSDIRVIVYYCWKRKMPAREIFQEVNNTLGSQTISLRTCYNLLNDYEAGRFQKVDAAREGRPSVDINDKIQELLDENGHHSCRNLAAELGVSPQTVCNHLHEMGKRYLANSWIPHRLTYENKIARVRACEELLAMQCENNFVNQLITMDEIWIYLDTESTGKQKKSWRGKEDPPVTLVKPDVARKCMYTIFWDSKGVLLLDVLPSGETFTSDYYCRLLDLLVINIRDKRRRSFAPYVWNISYQHDNARPHVARNSMQKLKDLHFHVIPHPPYSPDLAPSDFYLFSPLKAAIRGKIYATVDDLHADITHWLANKPKEFFQTAFEKLPSRWQKCVDHDGDYFSHLRDSHTDS